jgi:3-hydroxyisobutyrate dehydrogenase
MEAPPFSKPVGFIGLGSMGEPMALNLRKAGVPLVVWNRTPAKCDILAKAGASIASDVGALFSQCEIVIIILHTSDIIDKVLSRGTSAFTALVKGRTIINMGTTLPSYSSAFEADILAAGGAFVEAPVSGSRLPAEAGTLVAMLAGKPETIASVASVFAPMCQKTFACGPVPNALRMKLAVNIFLMATVTGLVEASHFALRQGLDFSTFTSILDSGQMASDISRAKTAKLRAGDFSKQAGISDAVENTRMILVAAEEAGISAPIAEICHQLYKETYAMGHENADMVAVLHAMTQRDT